jgi:hypothetical protein
MGTFLFETLSVRSSSLSLRLWHPRTHPNSYRVYGTRKETVTNRTPYAGRVVHGICKGAPLQEIGIFLRFILAIEALISINNRLHDAVLTDCERYDVLKHEGWYERLARWQEAFVAYERKGELDQKPQTFKSIA